MSFFSAPGITQTHAVWAPGHASSFSPFQCPPTRKLDVPHRLCQRALGTRAPSPLESRAVGGRFPASWWPSLRRLCRGIGLAGNRSPWKRARKAAMSEPARSAFALWPAPCPPGAVLFVSPPAAFPGRCTISLSFFLTPHLPVAVVSILASRASSPFLPRAPGGRTAMAVWARSCSQTPAALLPSAGYLSPRAANDPSWGFLGAKPSSWNKSHAFSAALRAQGGKPQRRNDSRARGGR